MNYLSRIEKLRTAIRERNCQAFIVSNVKDIFYLTGISVSLGKVLVTNEAASLIVDGRYYESSKGQSPIPVVLAEKESLWKLLGTVKALGFDSEAISYQAFIDFEKECNERSICLVPLRGVMEQLRAIKDAEEIALLRQAEELGSEGFDYLLTQLEEGITEEELSLRLEQFWRKKGASGFSFSPIIAFGPSSSMPHYRAGKGVLQRGEIVLIDIGVELNHYNSDMTRVVFFGKVNPELEKIHAIVLQAQQAALARCKPGVKAKELDSAARSIIAEQGYGANFNHSLGHGVGLDIHEFPSIKQDPILGETVLQEGMVVTVEPGIYLPGIGGVRIEDMVVITKEGYENLTNRSYTFHV